jgi:hypothetical protein
MVGNGSKMIAKKVRSLKMQYGSIDISCLNPLNTETFQIRDALKGTDDLKHRISLKRSHVQKTCKQAHVETLFFSFGWVCCTLFIHSIDQIHAHIVSNNENRYHILEISLTFIQDLVLHV